MEPRIGIRRTVGPEMPNGGEAFAPKPIPVGNRLVRRVDPPFGSWPRPKGPGFGGSPGGLAQAFSMLGD